MSRIYLTKIAALFLDASLSKIPFALKILGILALMICAVLFVAVAALFVWIRRLHPQIDDALSRVRSALHLISCYFLIYFWIFRFRLKSFVPSVVFATFLIAGTFTMLELILRAFEFIEKSWGSHLLPIATQSLARILAFSKGTSHRFFTSPYVLIPLFLVEALILSHHIQEHRRRHRETTTLAVLGELLLPLSHLSESLSSARDYQEHFAARIKFMEIFAVAFTKLLGLWGMKHTNICVMEFDQSREELVVVFENSFGRDFDKTFTLKRDEGGAGKAFAMKRLIYMPNIKYEHGVGVLPKKFDVVTDVYKEAHHPFKSIFCVPIANSSSNDQDPASTPVGVLNLSSLGKSAFSEPNFVIAKLGATVLGLMYN
jgi:hypothetical protein